MVISVYVYLRIASVANLQLFLIIFLMSLRPHIRSNYGIKILIQPLYRY